MYEVFVRFVDIGGIVDHHCWSSLDIIVREVSLSLFILVELLTITVETFFI